MEEPENINIQLGDITLHDNDDDDQHIIVTKDSTTNEIKKITWGSFSGNYISRFFTLDNIDECKNEYNSLWSWRNCTCNGSF